MDEELISKKELLELTDISYGQLYRWKRKNLIPEEWFIKKSSFTGQETFFPKNKILERIDKIKNMKDDVSLDDMAEVFSPQLAEIFLSREEMLDKDIVSSMTLEIYADMHKDEKTFTFEKILYLAIVEKFLQSGEAGVEEGRNILKTLEDNYSNFQNKHCSVVLLRKFGIAICFLALESNEIYIEKGAKLVLKLDVTKCIEEIKTKLGFSN